MSQSALRIHLLRHGQTDCSRDNVFCGSGNDAALTAQGHAMAQAFAMAYSHLDWAGIYSSPLTRALATAKPLAELCHLGIEQLDGLKEIDYGRWDGQKVRAVQHEFAAEYARWAVEPQWNAPPGGESAVEVAERGLRVIADVRQRFNDGNVLLVSHKATIRIILCRLLGIDLGRYRERLGCPVASLSVVEWTDTGPLLLALADRSHLPPALRELPGS